MADYGSPVPGTGAQMSAVLEAGKQAKFIRVVLLQ